MSPLEALTSSATSPLAGSKAAASEPIVTITPAAHAELVKLRDEEPDADKLGLRLALASAPGEDFRYDLSFDEYLTAAFTDEVRTHDGLKVIIPGNDLELLRGATLDYNDNQGLVIRNPNRPVAPTVEGERTVGDPRRRVGTHLDAPERDVEPGVAAMTVEERPVEPDPALGVLGAPVVADHGRPVVELDVPVAEAHRPADSRPRDG